MRNNYHLDTKKKILAIFVLVLLIGFLDFKTGIELSFQFFYIIPIFLYASIKHLRFIYLIGFALFVSFVWFLADYLAGREYPSILYYFWNTLSRFIMFSLLAIFQNINIKKQQKITSLNNELYSKNKHVLDSINYAQNIQNAIIPNFNSFNKNIQNSFIINIPKDVLSGDFFWHTKIENKIVFALVDCTGHGVPGALLSIIGNTMLNKIVIEEKIIIPNKILQKLNYEIITLFKNGDNYIDDGMEVSAFLFDLNNNSLTVSQTSQSSILIRNDKKILEFNFDFLTIGGTISKQKNIEYNNQTISIKDNDCLYLFTDGYIDQFGFKPNEKFGLQRFYDLIIIANKLDLDEQKNLFKNKLENWKKSMTQTDDITIISIRF